MSEQYTAHSRCAHELFTSHTHMYTYQATIKLHDTDAAGVLFFANYFRLTHEAYENLMTSLDFSFYKIIHESDWVVLIVHAETDFKKPLRVGDKVTVGIRTEKLGRTSYTLAYEVTNEAGETVATGNSVHAAITTADQKPMPLPDELRSGLEKIK